MMDSPPGNSFTLKAFRGGFLVNTILSATYERLLGGGPPPLVRQGPFRRIDALGGNNQAWQLFVCYLPFAYTVLRALRKIKLVHSKYAVGIEDDHETVIPLSHAFNKI